MLHAVVLISRSVSLSATIRPVYVCDGLDGTATPLHSRVCLVIDVHDTIPRMQGASGQAIQNMNLLMGLPEETGLLQMALFP